MSSKIYCTCTATVLENWTQITSTTGSKPYLEAKLQLDDEQRGDKRWDGRFVFVKSWSQRQYLPDLCRRSRVFVCGSIDARGYTSKAGKPAAQISIIVDRIEVEGVRDALPDAKPIADVIANPMPATAKLAAAKAEDDDDVPF